MITTVVTQMPEAASRKRPATFSEEMDATLYAEVIFNTELREVIPEINSTASEINDAKDSCTLSEQNSLAYMQTSLAAANFKGSWADLSGSLSIPASVEHDNKYWILLTSLADVTASEPGVDPEWGRLFSPQIGDIFLTSVGDVEAANRNMIPCDGSSYLQTAHPALYAVLGSIVDYGGAVDVPMLSATIEIAKQDADYLYLMDTGSDYKFYVVAKTDFSIVSGTPTFTGELRCMDVDDDYIYVGFGSWPYLLVLDKTDFSGVTAPSPGTNIYAISHDVSFLYFVHPNPPYFNVVNKTGFTLVSGTPTLQASAWETGSQAKFIHDANYVYFLTNVTPFLKVINKAGWSVVSGAPALTGKILFSDENSSNVFFVSTKIEAINRSTLALTTGPIVSTNVTDMVVTDDYVFLAQNDDPHIAVYNTSDLTLNYELTSIFSGDIGQVKITLIGSKLFVASQYGTYLKCVDLAIGKVEYAGMADTDASGFIIYDDASDIIYHSLPGPPFIAAKSPYSYNPLTEFVVPKIEIPGSPAYIIYA